MRGFDRDLIRGGHYGQRSCEPHLQAEHMAAPTNAAKREESSCQLGAVHTWHKTDIAVVSPNVRFPNTDMNRVRSRDPSARELRPKSQSAHPLRAHIVIGGLNDRVGVIADGN